MQKYEIKIKGITPKKRVFPPWCLLVYSEGAFGSTLNGASLY